MKITYAQGNPIKGSDIRGFKKGEGNNVMYECITYNQAKKTYDYIEDKIKDNPDGEHYFPIRSRFFTKFYPELMSIEGINANTVVLYGILRNESKMERNKWYTIAIRNFQYLVNTQGVNCKEIKNSPTYTSFCRPGIYEKIMKIKTPQNFLKETTLWSIFGTDLKKIKDFPKEVKTKHIQEFMTGISNVTIRNSLMFLEEAGLIHMDIMNNNRRFITIVVDLEEYSSEGFYEWHKATGEAIKIWEKSWKSFEEDMEDKDGSEDKQGKEGREDIVSKRVTIFPPDQIDKYVSEHEIRECGDYEDKEENWENFEDYDPIEDGVI